MTLFPFARRLLVTVVLAVAPAAGLLATPTTAAAQSTQAGPFALRNTSGSPITLENMTYTDAFGATQKLDLIWDIKAGFYGHLVKGNDKIIARSVSLELVTAAGRTRITWEAKSLDKDGNFVALLGANDLAQHRKLLGADAPVQAGGWNFQPAPAAGPTQEQLERGLTKVLGAVLANAIAQKEPEDLLEAILTEAARKARDEVIQSAFTDLFPQLSAVEVNAARRTVCLALDGKLTVNQFNKDRAKEELVAQLRRTNPDFAQAAEVADFIYKVQQAAPK